jgi:hypothetical protein
MTLENLKKAKPLRRSSLRFAECAVILWIISGFLQSLVHSSSLCAFAFCSVKFCPQMDLRFVPLIFSPFHLGFFQSFNLFLFFSQSSQSKSFLYFSDGYPYYLQTADPGKLSSLIEVDRFIQNHHHLVWLRKRHGEY